LVGIEATISEGNGLDGGLAGDPGC
jgi:hypothetical protein